MGKRGLISVISIFFLIVLTLISVNSINASPSFYVEKGTNYTITFGCDIDGAVCSSSALCNLTIRYDPNSTLLFSDEETTNLINGNFEYNLTGSQTQWKGEYTARVVCFDGNVNGTSSFVYEVNQAGIRPSDQRTGATTRSIYFIFGLGILFFIAFLFVKNSLPVKWTFFILGAMFFLIALNILFVGLQDEGVNPRLESFFDKFTAISWIMFWFMAGLLAVMWALTFIQTIFFKKNLENLRRFGGE